MAELKVVITDGTSNQQVSLGGAKPQPTSVPTPEVAHSKASSKALSIAAMLGRNALSYTTSNIGKWTGSSRYQTAVDNAKEIGSIMALATINPGLAAATVGMQLATTAIDNYHDTKWEARTANQARARAGLDSNNKLAGRRH